MNTETPPEFTPAPDEGMTPPPMQAAPMHGAPPGWRPLSGLAVTMFILSLITGLAAAIVGYWWLSVVCLGFSIFACVRANPRHVRGRGFAISAIVISTLAAAFSALLLFGLHQMSMDVTAAVFRITTTEGVQAKDRIHELGKWIHEDVEDKNVTADIVARVRELEARMGKFQDTLRPASVFTGHFPVFTGPSDRSLRRIGAPEEGVPPLTGGVRAIWGRAQFEKGEVYVACLFFDAEATTETLKERADTETDAVRIFKDFHFFVPAAEK